MPPSSYIILHLSQPPLPYVKSSLLKTLSIGTVNSFNKAVVTFNTWFEFVWIQSSSSYHKTPNAKSLVIFITCKLHVISETYYQILAKWTLTIISVANTIDRLVTEHFLLKHAVPEYTNYTPFMTRCPWKISMFWIKLKLWRPIQYKDAFL